MPKIVNSKCQYCGRRHRKHIKRCARCGGNRANYHPCKKCGYMSDTELKVKTLPDVIMSQRHQINKARRTS